MEKKSLEVTIECARCKKSFEVEGEDSLQKRPIEFGCPYCKSPIRLEWPANGIIFVRYIPEEM
jgi:DNA-directed RNA polymerase subunit RPC12/RpoP